VSPMIQYVNQKQPKLYEFRFTVKLAPPYAAHMIGLVWGMTSTEARRKINRHLKKCDGKLTNFQRIAYTEEVTVLGRWAP